MVQKVYKTSFAFADRQNIDKSVYEMIEKTMQSTPLFRNKQLFFQYVILLYMGGKRRIEPFLMPVTIYKHEDDKIKYYEIKSGLAKHFKGGIIKCNQCNQIFKIIKAYKMHKKQIHKEQEESNSNKHLYSHYGQRKYIESPIIADNEYEHAMMQYLLQGRQRVIIDFTPLLPPRARKLNYEELMSMEYNSNIYILSICKTKACFIYFLNHQFSPCGTNNVITYKIAIVITSKVANHPIVVSDEATSAYVIIVYANATANRFVLLSICVVTPIRYSEIPNRNKVMNGKNQG